MECPSSAFLVVKKFPEAKQVTDEKGTVYKCWYEAIKDSICVILHWYVSDFIIHHKTKGPTPRLKTRDQRLIDLLIEGKLTKS